MEGHPAERTTTLSPIFEDVLESDIFVDKSALILAVFEKNEQPMVLCTAPRRFGKSVNLTMMQRFLELEVDENGKEKITVLEEKDNYKLFNSSRIKLKVMENKEFVKTHFGQYPIIKLNFLCTPKIKKASDAVNVCREAIREAFLEHEYLYESTLSSLKAYEKKYCELWCGKFTYKGIPDDDDVRSGLSCLAVYLNKYHKKKVFLLVDEYDSIISNALYNMENADPKAELKELESAASFPIEVIGDALKRKPEIFKGAYITGILDVSDGRLSSLFGSVMRRQFGTSNLCQDFYGFTEDEVDTLFNRFEVEEGLKKKAKAKYKGYINGAKKRLYNPQTVVQFLGNLALGEHALKNYWQQSGYIENMYVLFQEDSVRMLLDKLLQGVTDFKFKLGPLELSHLKSLHNILINRNLTCDVKIVVQFLVSLGYLTYSWDDYKLQIPNGEIIDEFMARRRSYFFERYGINSRLANACSASFSKLTKLCDEDDSLAKFQEELADFQNTITCLLQESDIIDPLNEATLQSIITMTCTGNRFLFGTEIIIPNYGTKIDVILYNDKSGIIMDLKCDPHAGEDAVEQVFKNHYCNVFTMTKYFNDRQKAPSLSLVMGMHVDSEKKASVVCLRKKDIIDVLDDHKVGAEPSLENRIEISVNCMGEDVINSFCERAIRVS